MTSDAASAPVPPLIVPLLSTTMLLPARPAPPLPLTPPPNGPLEEALAPLPPRIVPALLVTLRLSPLMAAAPAPPTPPLSMPPS
ncbi:hypothetical protein [Paraburkholderia tropica]|uniref:hypothetical protein n=1 Tax=Paraburkholderia tropica TaxID=92647 RepID=UPI002AB001EA|nr:hypothetical protein [Paraburkholderia tropica]